MIRLQRCRFGGPRCILFRFGASTLYRFSKGPEMTPRRRSIPWIRWSVLNSFLCVTAIGMLTPLHAQTIDFEKQIAPILVSHCLECHRGPNPEGGLNLTERALARKGGDSGESILDGGVSESHLWRRVSADEMPPKHPVSEAKKGVLKQWIEEGAIWGDGVLDLFSITTDSRAGRDWCRCNRFARSPPRHRSLHGNAMQSMDSCFGVCAKKASFHRQKRNRAT